MCSHRSNWLVALMIFAGGGALYEITTGACAAFGGNYALTAFDSCWLLDCSNGIGGGAIPLCDSSDPTKNLLLDCLPLYASPGGNSAGNSGVNSGSNSGGGSGGSGGSGGTDSGTGGSGSTPTMAGGGT